MQIGVIARPGGPCRLNLVAAGGIPLQVEAIGKSSIEILEVRVGGEATTGDTLVPLPGVPPVFWFTIASE